MGTIAWVLTTAVLAAATPSPQAVAEKDRGDRLAANADTAGAIEAYNAALKITPEYAAAYNGIGVVHAGADRKEDAIGFFQKAIAADANFALPYNNVGYMYRKSNRWVEAISAYKKYSELEPGDVAGYYGLAESYRGAGDKQSALAAYEVYLGKDKDPVNQKRIDKARGFAEALRTELPAAPAATPSATVNPAAVAAVTPAAAPVAKAAPVTSPSGVVVSPERQAFSRGKLAEGMSLRAAGKARDSLFAVQDAANADPTNAQAVFELGVAYAMMNYYPQAIERWQRVVSMPVDEGTRASAQANIDKARAKMGGMGAPVSNPAAAAAAATTVTPATAGTVATPVQTSAVVAPPAPLPTDAQDAYNQGVKLYTEQKYADAVQAFSRAIKSKIDFPQAFSARGSAYYAQHDYPNALNDYGQSMRLDPKLASPVFGVAEALNALNRKSEAVPYYEAYAGSQAPDAQANLQALARQRVTEIKK